MRPLLELEDVHAHYGETTALHGVSLRVDEGSSPRAGKFYRFINCRMFRSFEEKKLVEAESQ